MYADNSFLYFLCMLPARSNPEPFIPLAPQTRGDMVANEVKITKPEPASVLAELHLMVTKEEAPDVYNLAVDDALEVGPFVGAGIDLRSSGLMAIYR